MRIGELAERVGVATHVLRHWEDVGVLVPERSSSGHRSYTDEHLVRARLILLCQRAGLSLRDIAELLRNGPSGRAARLVDHRREIGARIDDLQRTDAFLAHVLHCRHPLVSECPECSGFSASARTPTRFVG